MTCANVLNTRLIFVPRHAGLRAHAVGDVLLVESANSGVLVCPVLLTLEGRRIHSTNLYANMELIWQIIISCPAVVQPQGFDALVARNKPLLASFSGNLTVFGLGNAVRCERNRTDIGLSQTRQWQVLECNRPQAKGCLVLMRRRFFLRPLGTALPMPGFELHTCIPD